MDAKRLSAQQQFWKDHLDKQETTGLSRARYCREHGLKGDQMSYHASRLRRKTEIFAAALPDFVSIKPSPQSQKIVLRVSAEVSFELPLDPGLIAAIIGQLR